MPGFFYDTIRTELRAKDFVGARAKVHSEFPIGSGDFYTWSSIVEREAGFRKEAADLAYKGLVVGAPKLGLIIHCLELVSNKNERRLAEKLFEVVGVSHPEYTTGALLQIAYSMYFQENMIDSIKCDAGDDVFSIGDFDAEITNFLAENYRWNEGCFELK